MAEWRPARDHVFMISGATGGARRYRMSDAERQLREDQERRERGE